VLKCLLLCCADLEGHGGHLRLAGNWLELDLAENSWELRDLLEEDLSRQSTLLKRAGQDRWLWDTGKLNRLLLDGQWLGQADLDHLLGDAEVGRLLLNNVHHAGWLGQDRDGLVQLGDWGWDDDLTGAFSRQPHELWLEGCWDTSATLKARGRSRLVDNEGKSSQVWWHDTHAWGLKVSRLLTIHITAKANSARLQELWGNNLNQDAVRQDLQALLWDVDRDDIVLEVLDDDKDLALWALLDELLTNSWEAQLLSIDHNLHGTSAWDQQNFSDAGQDLDNLLLSLNSPGGDSNWDVLGSVQKKDVLTVIDLVTDSHIVKGANK